MSESNYPFTQLEMVISDHHQLAQTFTPLESHEIIHASVKLHITGSVISITVSLYRTDAAGWPAGPPLAQHTFDNPAPYYSRPIQTYLATFYEIQLIAGLEYALVISKEAKAWFTSPTAIYEPPIGHYPRGKLIESTDDGATWNTTDKGDLFFAEWGVPPVFPSPTLPPLDKFALVDFQIRHFTSGAIIRVPTNVPCHLTAYFTRIPPRQYHRSRTIRGLKVPWHTYFSFAGWEALEQQEYSSSIYHTFAFKDWPAHETRWLTFRGETDWVRAPSIGPIFKHFHPGQDIILNPTYWDWPVAQQVPSHWFWYSNWTPNPTITPDYDIWKQDAVAPRQCIGSYPGSTNLRQNLDISLLAGQTLKFSLWLRGLPRYNNCARIMVYPGMPVGYYLPVTKNYEWEHQERTITLPDDLTGISVLSRARYNFPGENVCIWSDDWQVHLA